MQSTSPSRMARLRESLASHTTQHSYRSWSDIVQLFEEWENTPERALALEYVSRHVEHWPCKQRSLQGYNSFHPIWPLVRHLILQAEWPQGQHGPQELLNVRHLTCFTAQMMSRSHASNLFTRLLPAEFSQPRWKQLTTLNIQFCSHLEDWFFPLVSKAKLPNLVHLNLQGTSLQQHDILKGLRSEDWGLGTTLKTLDLTGSITLTSEILDALAKRKSMASLENLSFAKSRYHDHGVIAPFLQREWSSLESLSLHTTEFVAEDYVRLFTASSLPALKHLNIGNIGWSFVSRALVDTEWTLPSLRHLEFPSTPLQEEQLRQLGQNPSLQSLDTLDLRSTALTNKGLKALLSEGNLKNLRTLNLSGNSLTERGARHLLKAGRLPSLQSVDLRWNAIPEKVHAALQERFEQVLLT